MGSPPIKALIPKDNYCGCADTKDIARVDSLFVTEICEKEHSIYRVILQKSLTPNLDLVKASLSSILSLPLTLTLERNEGNASFARHPQHQRDAE